MNIVIAKRIIVTLAFVALSLSIFFHNLFFNLLTEETYPDVGISSNENNLFLTIIILLSLPTYLFLNLIDKKSFWNVPTFWFGITFVIGMTIIMMSPTDFIFSDSTNVIALRYFFFTMIGALITINVLEEYPKN